MAIVSITLALSILAVIFSATAFFAAIYSIVEVRAAAKSTHTLVNSMAPIGFSDIEAERNLARAEDLPIHVTFEDD